MIRVFLISVLALGALVLVSRSLPEVAAPASGPIEPPPRSQGDILSGWEGSWEGTFKAYRPDGSLEWTSQMRHDHANVSPSQQSLVITDRRHGEPEARSRGQITLLEGGRVECRIWQADGSMELFTGQVAGGAVIWHRADPAAGTHEVFREEVIRSERGDQYAVDGFGVYPDGPRLYEGRYRRIIE